MADIILKFDASLHERDSGAAFKIVCRDTTHARQVVAWLSTKTEFDGCIMETTVPYGDYYNNPKKGA